MILSTLLPILQQGEDLITAYFRLQAEIYSLFDYVEDWRVIPLDDQRHRHWYYDGNETHGTVWFSDQELTTEILQEGKHLYSATLYTQRFLPRWIYRADGLTMICADTHTDGNKFLMIFSNELEIKELTAEQEEALSC
jgi:hypothetical protein